MTIHPSIFISSKILIFFSTNRFKFVLSPGPTIASRAFLKDTQTGNIGDLIEVSPEASVLAESIAMRISKQQGAALIVDYGEDFPMPNTLRVIKIGNKNNFKGNPKSSI